MPKNVVLESIKHQLYNAIRRRQALPTAPLDEKWVQFLETFELLIVDESSCELTWKKPCSSKILIDRNLFAFYQRGSLPSKIADPEEKNRIAADAVVQSIAEQMGIPPTIQPSDNLTNREQSFHDKWASEVNPEDVLVNQSFEACTAPENRYILWALGDIRGKKILDLGCGLGEGAIYFAKKGADVTAADLSPEMLKMVLKVADLHGVKVKTHLSTAEKTGLSEGTFDVVYAANILHHSDIPVVLDEAARLLRPNGLFVSWDPLIHNPVINVYRKLAQAVRTVDEHPLDIKELRYFKQRFKNVEWKCFWFLTLAIFLRFYFWERSDPSKERYWKKILNDEKRLKNFYGRLEKADRFLLAVFPFLRKYCWNIVIIGRRP